MNEEKEWHVPVESDDYKLDNSRPLTIKERLEIYVKLTKQQRELIDAHRKYLIRSEFLKDNYLKASDWEFLDLKIDENYPNTIDEKNKLYCQCGRRLKYQYIVRSKATNQTMGLGIQHFKDHLNIPSQVAKEIVDRLNNVDFALDELLWLKRRGFEFPEGLWKSYAFFVYQNQFRKVPYDINVSLGRRFADFKEVEMPIYVSDYHEILREIEQLRIFHEPITHPIYNEENFRHFETNLVANIQQETLFHQASIWSSQIQKRIKTHQEQPSLPNHFFEEIVTILEKESPVREKELMLFANKGMGKWLQKEVYLHLLERVEANGLNEVTLNEIHPFMRDGLLSCIEKKEKTEAVTTSLEKIKTILRELDNESRETLMKQLKKEWQE